jgi:hypothetical protein
VVGEVVRVRDTLLALNDDVARTASPAHTAVLIEA